MSRDSVVGFNEVVSYHGEVFVRCGGFPSSVEHSCEGVVGAMAWSTPELVCVEHLFQFLACSVFDGGFGNFGGDD